jgi:ABC-type transporter Mla subunit MlaD
MVAVAALSAFVFFLGDMRALLERRYELIVVFAQGPRLREGSPVWIGGHEVGRVKAIGFLPVRADSAPRLAVRIEIPHRHRELVRSDSRARLTSARTIGEPVVDISPGSRSARELAPGDTLFSEPATDLLSAFQTWRRFQSTLDTLVKSARVLQPRIAARKPQLVRLATSVQQTKAEFARVSALLQESSLAELVTAGSLQSAVSDLSATARQLGPTLRAAGERYNDPALRAALGRMGAHADSFSLQLNALAQQFGNSSLSRFASDSALQKALHKSQIELDSLIAETKRNPLRFWLGNRN